MSKTDAPATASPPSEVYDLLARTNKKNPSAKDVEALRKALREYPSVWKDFGDLARLTQHQIISELPANKALTESLHRGAHEMRKEMGYKTA